MITSDWKNADIGVHKELIDILDILIKRYKRTQEPELAEEIIKMHELAKEIQHRIDTFDYPVEKISLSFIKQGKI